VSATGFRQETTMSALGSVKKLARTALFGSLVPQSLWVRLHGLALQGMNIGSGSDVRDSGELWVMHWLRARAPSTRKPLVFDVGANIGLYTRKLHEEFGGAVEVVCFEPSPTTFGKLKSAIGGVPGVRLVPLGLGDAPGKLALYTDPNNDALASVYNRDLRHVGLELTHEEQIETTTLDDFCASERIDHIDFMKLDCEGHELKILEGGRNMLERCAVDAIQFEFGGSNLDSRTYLRDFFTLLGDRYDIHRVLRNGLFRIDRYREVHEVFTTTNFLAVAKSRR
jgi:FkbM family methyltransferase